MSQANAATKASSDVFFNASLEDIDPEIFGAIRNELGRQRHEIELIASENIVSRAVLEAQGSILTNKYAEGYPGKRYYGGCQYVDVVEELAIERAKKLFGAEFANVQPNSGSQMNQAVFLALLQPGDTFMGLDLNSGGHLTHGSPVNMSGKWFNVVSYGVRKDDHLLDMDEVARLARENKPKLILAGGRPIRVSGTGSVSARSPMKWALISWSIWRILPVSWLAVSIRRRFPMPMSAPRQRTNRFAVRAAA